MLSELWEEESILLLISDTMIICSNIYSMSALIVPTSHGVKAIIDYIETKKFGQKEIFFLQQSLHSTFTVKHSLSVKAAQLSQGQKYS